MAESFLAEYGLDRPESGDDKSVPFTLDRLDCRGRSVRLGAAIDTILRRHDYPAPVARLLGEAVVLASLIGSSLKFDGKFILQTQTDGPVNMMVVDLDAPDGLRGYARFDAEAVEKLIAAGETGAGQYLGKGSLAMTVDQGAHMDRYQGIVDLNGDSIEEVAHRYFQLSEQIPTLVRIAVAELSRRGEPTRWRAGGVLLQYLPEDGTRSFDLPGGDNPAGEDEAALPEEDDRWVEAKALLFSVTDAELADPDISAERLLFRLYHETGVRVFEPEHMEERCSCSAERIEAMLQNGFSGDERDEMAADGEIEVVCEFCSTAYRFNPHHFDSGE
jgi:molecular chaperone Hsp33